MKQLNKGLLTALIISGLSGVANAEIASKSYVDTGLTTKANTADLGTLAVKNTVGTTDIDDASVTKPKLSVAVQATLDKADAAVQSADLTDYATNASVSSALSTKADVATTIAGYGITDAMTTTAINTALGAKADQATTYTKTEVDTSLGAKADVATTYTKTEVDTSLGTKADVATTYTKTEVDTALVGKADTATTLAGYGITDAATAAELATKADAATTIAGYGITDAMTTTAINTALGAKADQATTYTKTEVDTSLGLKANTADLGTLASAAPGACSDAINKCVLTFDGTTYGWEVVER